MNVFTMVVIIVAMALAAGIVKHVIDARASRPDPADRLGELDLEEKLKRLDELDERVRVLERIVTDKRTHLVDEIERLDG